MPRKVYAFQNNKKNLQKATSGGAFIALADAFLKKYSRHQTYIYGVTYDQNLNVHYEVANTLEECEKFSGSKYVRSDISGVYNSIKENLADDGAALFIGTPCHVAGLQNFLHRHNINQKNLICIDLICHGTPQPIYWRTYRDWLEKKYKSTLLDFKFRTHEDSIFEYVSLAKFENGKIYMNTPETQIYNRLFLQHYLFSEGCFRCKFANLDRRGDVTIGDFWGIETVMPHYPYTKNVSEILVNSEKGEELVQILIDSAQVQGYCMEQCWSDEYVKYQNNLQRPAYKPKDYEIFQKDFQNRGIHFVAAKYVGYDMLHRMKYYLFRR